ncbi:MAG: hypothetical protein AAGF82_19485, partial [Pseudomonadota bacterium]
MRRLAGCSSKQPLIRSRLLAACSFCLLTYSAGAVAQSVPETVRINVQPADPGIRSITVDKKYRPIISRDDKGVVIDTMGSDNTLPGCDVKLEVTLENSRVLHRDANLCSGSTLVVDVTSDGKPGATARVVGASSGVAAGPVTNAPAATGSPQTQTQTSSVEQAGQGTETSIVEVAPPADSGGLPPLEQVETPISSSDPNADTVAS